MKLSFNLTDRVVDLVRDMGGKPESSILGFGGRAPALMAAFANGAMAHGLDFDDHAPEGHHPSSSIVPAVFALAEVLARVKALADGAHSA